jgi:hypothetical protein
VADDFEAAAVASDMWFRLPARFRPVARFREKGITIATPLELMQAQKP